MKTDKDQSKHLTNLRATAPGALEDLSPEAWQEFQALQNAEERGFLPTRPNTMPSPLAQPAKAAQPRAARPAVTMEQAMVTARRNNRACPLPAHWAQFHALLAKAAQDGSTPPAAIDGAAWNAIPPMQKRLRLRDQLEWALKNGCLDGAHELLSRLPEDDWLHF